MSEPLPWAYIDPEKALPWIERKTGLALADSQRTAISLTLRSKVLVITGGPGLGKTTIVNAILRILAAESGSPDGLAYSDFCVPGLAPSRWPSGVRTSI